MIIFWVYQNNSIKISFTFCLKFYIAHVAHIIFLWDSDLCIYLWYLLPTFLPSRAPHGLSVWFSISLFILYVPVGNLSIPHCFSLSPVGHLSILVIISHIAIKLPLRGYLYLIDSHSS